MIVLSIQRNRNNCIHSVSDATNVVEVDLSGAPRRVSGSSLEWVVIKNDTTEPFLVIEISTSEGEELSPGSSILFFKTVYEQSRVGCIQTGGSSVDVSTEISELTRRLDEQGKIVSSLESYENISIYHESTTVDDPQPVVFTDDISAIYANQTGKDGETAYIKIYGEARDRKVGSLVIIKNPKANTHISCGDAITLVVDGTAVKTIELFGKGLIKIESIFPKVWAITIGN